MDLRKLIKETLEEHLNKSLIIKEDVKDFCIKSWFQFLSNRIGKYCPRCNSIQLEKQDVGFIHYHNPINYYKRIVHGCASYFKTLKDGFKRK